MGRGFTAQSGRGFKKVDPHLVQFSIQVYAIAFAVHAALEKVYRET